MILLRENDNEKFVNEKPSNLVDIKRKTNTL